MRDDLEATGLVKEEGSRALIASVVIPTRSRRQALERCLDALARQAMPPGSFEVIVVDDGSPEPLVLEEGRWAGKYELLCIRQRNTGPSGARNKGSSVARGRFLCFTDDDCVPESGWIASLVSFLGNHPEALAGGITRNGAKDNLCAVTNQLILDFASSHYNRDPDDPFLLTSNNMACRRESFFLVGGFDERFRMPGGEDRDFCDSWRASQARLAIVEGATVFHYHRQSLFRFIAMYFRYGRGAYLYRYGRLERRTGTMKEMMEFHRRLPQLLIKELPRLNGWSRRVSILALMMIWQIANAAGFAWEAWSLFIKRDDGKSA